MATFNEPTYTTVDKVNFEIDYHIIEHFSKHLYSSPYKAIEELVVNGYDAGATCVNVFTPGQYTDKIIVFDDGLSMDISGLKKLWKVADSPKKGIPDRILSIRGERRKMIGKFGIGKIASYTLGKTITHFCKADNKYYMVKIDYSDLMSNEQSGGIVKSHSMDHSDVSPTKKNYSSPIFELRKDEALVAFQSNFNEDFRGQELSLFEKDTWTLAVIDDIKPNINITQGRLSWILGNGMPIQPNFTVYVNQNLIQRSITKNGIIHNWDFSTQEVQNQIKSKWEDARKLGKVNGDVTFGSEKAIDPSNPERETPYVEFPNIGKVWGKITLYNKSLLIDRSTDNGRSHGFFILVRNRLINAGDEQFLLSDPSFGTFYSSQYVINIDGLDDELLADRERIQEDSVKYTELELLQKAVYLSLVNAQKSHFDKLSEGALVQYRLPLTSAEYFIQPLAALWLNEGGGDTLGFDFREPKIDAFPLGEDSYISNFSPTEGFKINSSHPYYQNLSRLFGSGKGSQKVVKEFEVIAISEQLFQGYLYEIGLPKNQILDIMKWRDALYRQIAKGDTKNKHQLATALREASYKSGEVFENAVVAVLREIGFYAERDGKSGKKDVYVKAFCGDNSYKLIFEAKGNSSEKGIPNDDAETGGANSHRIEADADFAIIISRKFAGFDRATDTEPAIIQECKAAGTVSILEVESLIDIMFAVAEHSYSLSTIKELFTKIESPNEKRESIKKFSQPLEQFDYVDCLNRIWDYQGSTGDGDLISCKHIWQTNYKSEMKEEEFISKIEALRTIAFPLIQYNNSQKELALTQSPENILSYINLKFSINNKQ